jgi:uncharacterized protein YqjF (DUF2071 family)
MANYIIDPKLLRPYLPGKTEVDEWNGNCYVSLVAFMFLNTRVKRCSVPFHKNFEEVNLRFYVRYKEGNAWKRGTVFIREFVPLRMVTMVANTVYDEKYKTVPMRHEWLITEEGLRISYQWKIRNWHTLAVHAANEQQTIAPGSKEEFITQHFCGYSQKKSYTSAYEVAHDPWKLYPLLDTTINVNFEDCYGKDFSYLNAAAADSVFLVEGSPITVYRDRKIW